MSYMTNGIKISATMRDLIFVATGKLISIKTITLINETCD